MQRSGILISIVLWMFVSAACDVNTGRSADRKKEGVQLNTDDIGGSSIPELQQKIVNGTLTSEQITRYFLGQIATHNDTLHAVIAVNPQAIDQARLQDQARNDSGDDNSNEENSREDNLSETSRADDVTADLALKALSGIPVLIKDNIETRENATTAGSLALEGNFTGRDAALIQRLRAQGAIILGKANLSEWANFRSVRSSSGWSATGGQTRNPNDITRSPCGSSSGSGAAVAAGLAPVAVGTETDGSIVCPASVNGVVGIKPTVGLVSTGGIVPISYSQDTAGPMAENVRDAARLLAAMLSDPDSALAHRLLQLQPAQLPGKRIGVLRSAAGFHEGVDAEFNRAINTLAAAGVEIVDGLELKLYEGARQDILNVLLYQFKAGLNDYLAGLPGPFSELSLNRLIAFNQENAAREMAYFGQEIFLQAEAKGDLNSSEYLGALERIQRATRAEGLDRLLEEHDLDALIAPTTGAAWSIDLINGDHYLGGFSSYPAIAGYPHITLPMGEVHGLPVGLSFTGRKLSDGELSALALSFEQLNDEGPHPL